MAEAEDNLKELIGEVLARRANDTRFRSAVARGLEPTTEQYAYPWVLRWVDRERDKTAFLRAAGLAATYPDIPQASLSLGSSLRSVSLKRSGKNSLDPAKPDVIASRLATLQEQDLEEAVTTIRRFLSLARSTSGTPVGFDFYRIGRLLTHWGNGFTEVSQSLRRRTIGEYYGAWTFDTASIPSSGITDTKIQEQ
ncbi:type I-E CRISPR-associated protein Cse2/CasB [Arthrobacter sp.]|uniref:type I-E CRISPR-associated protein Cse2/CasB n=1 Tax=Arthrobacter sp. TaxID=1667 RepID=UPI0026DF331A|nr:type I-E CRISPR-associated protein Cse2/CasB [Arthrobacter sp.]MDO5752440.1 type I-E CRISPR-associated protein Cse2/CasB [Arthrobacter sp.]